MNALDLFKALADPTRLACVLALHQRGELCVCDLHGLLEVSQPKMSRHLALLRQANLLTLRKKGLWVYYQLNPQMPAWAFQIIQQAALGFPAMIPSAGGCAPNNIC
jgi:ArsR family transcriptional regulator, arsenate/arsenite/antimonite-responsive transcriptional repressor